MKPKLFSASSHEFLGVNVVDGLVMGAGLFLTSFGKKKVTDPLLAKVPFIASQTGALHDAIDIGSAAATAAVESTVISMVSPRFGRDIAAAGVAYTSAKVLALPFSGTGFDDSIPQFFSNLRTNAMGTTKAANGKTPAITSGPDTLQNVPKGTSTRSAVAL